MSQDEASKKEEERLNRTLNNIGRRGAGAPASRPTTWHVSQPTGLKGGARGGSIGKNSGIAGLQALQDQIREEERRQEEEKRLAQQAAQHVHPGHPQYVAPPPQSGPSPPPQVSHSSSIGSSVVQSNLLGEELTPDAEKERKMRQEEERLERWMRKGGSRFETTDRTEKRRSVESIFNSSTSPEPQQQYRSTPSPASSASLSSLSAKFQESIVQASKALRQRRSEDLVKQCFTTVTTAKAIAEALSDDSEISSFAKALEAGASLLRTNLDSGGDGQKHYQEISSYLGQLYISTIGAV